MIDYTYKFIYTRVAKTGSTSLLNKLYDKTEYKDLNLHKLDVSKYWNGDTNHYPLYITKKIVKIENFKKYFKFAFVRNPFDRIVSAFFYDTQFHNLDMKFKDFLYSDKIPAKYDMNQYDFVEGCDFIGKFENLQSDFNFICDKLHIPRRNLEIDNNSDHKNYTEYYDEEMQEFVRRKYAKDIEYFAYEFGN